MERRDHTDESIHAAYQQLDATLESLDYGGFLALLSADHQTVHPDERRVTRRELDAAPFPFDGLRGCQTHHTPLRIHFAPSGCTVFAESSSTMRLGSRDYQEEKVVQDHWRLHGGEWKLCRRIILRLKRKAPDHFSLVEHPLYCQFGHCRTEKRTWKDPLARRSASGR